MYKFKIGDTVTGTIKSQVFYGKKTKVDSKEENWHGLGIRYVLEGHSSHWREGELKLIEKKSLKNWLKNEP